MDETFSLPPELERDARSCCATNDVTRPALHAALPPSSRLSTSRAPPAGTSCPFKCLSVDGVLDNLINLREAAERLNNTRVKSSMLPSFLPLARQPFLTLQGRGRFAQGVASCGRAGSGERVHAGGEYSTGERTPTRRDKTTGKSRERHEALTGEGGEQAGPSSPTTHLKPTPLPGSPPAAAAAAAAAVPSTATLSCPCLAST
ncbi:hypothetical protein E2C01_033311 [Portunus trituberculatus]|uniref:Uncharacterized protein n=1 Tax=Portunus trituberculatus TaxID=210409 RepID=A0A5B7EZT5_PORTR|nr:hypothetical protein [Portunus trituberculatus]